MWQTPQEIEIATSSTPAGVEIVEISELTHLTVYYMTFIGPGSMYLN